MSASKAHTCSICGDPEPDASIWFLVRENHLEDKVQILHWNDRLVGGAGVYPACSAAHVQEMVVHWMTTGSLSYPFALVRGRDAEERHGGNRGRGAAQVVFREARPIGELSVDRDSMKRVLNESPHSLRTILDALLSALQPPVTASDEVASEQEMAGSTAWEV
jgi:hypothetical protein